MSPRLRRRLIKVGTLSIAAIALATTAAVVITHNQPDNNVTVVAVESRSPAATVEADLAGELAQALAAGGDLIVSAIGDQSAAPALDVELGCPAETDPISCNQDRQHQSTTILQVADRLASGPHPAQVDLYATFSQLSGYLAETPAKHGGSVSVFVNTLGDAAIPQDLTTADLATPATVDALARQAVSEGAFPGPRGCAGWQVHMVVPAGADPAYDNGLRRLFITLISGCGGTLASWTDRWLVPSNAPLALPPIPAGVTPSAPNQAQPSFILRDTYFAVGSSVISAAGISALKAVATDIEARYPSNPITCEGSADGTGGSSPAVLAYDQTLSTTRSAAVCAALVAQGIAQGLTSSHGLGQTAAVPNAAARSVRIVVGQVGS